MTGKTDKRANCATRWGRKGRKRAEDATARPERKHGVCKLAFRSLGLLRGGEEEAPRQRGKRSEGTGQWRCKAKWVGEVQRQKGEALSGGTKSVKRKGTLTLKGKKRGQIVSRVSL